MNLNKYLDVKPEVAQAIAQGKPVVALESTIISHGMPLSPECGDGSERGENHPGKTERCPPPSPSSAAA